jgi:hypothetical protein
MPSITVVHNQFAGEPVGGTGSLATDLRLSRMGLLEFSGDALAGPSGLRVYYLALK